MEVRTTRFGKLEIDPADILRFPLGLLGLCACREWVLIADAHHDALSWLQSVSRPDVAVAVVSPRRFVPDFQVRVARGDLTSLALARVEDAQVLVVLSRDDRGQFTLNLKAPLVLNIAQRMGRQVICESELPLQYVLGDLRPRPMKKSA
jgi:flagellar assembly factor FliW